MATQLFHTASTDVTWLFIGSSTWTAVEVNLGIVSGKSLPVLSNVRTARRLPHLRPHKSIQADPIAKQVYQHASRLSVPS